MLCAVVLRRIFVPQAKTILLVKQRLFHLFTDLTNTSYSLLRRIMTPSVPGELRLVLSNTSKTQIRVFFGNSVTKGVI